MKVTSYFVGITLEKTYFVDLFIKLQSYVKEHDIEEAIEFQNILSLHVTLYYLGDKPTEENKHQIIRDLSKLSSIYRDIAISPLKSSYFTEGGKDTLCYLTCSQKEVLEEINNFFVKKYNYSQVQENHYTYIPHISLFKILDHQKYAPHKETLIPLIEEELTSIQSSSIEKNLHLFQVNSRFHPEIQIPLL